MKNRTNSTRANRSRTHVSRRSIAFACYGLMLLCELSLSPAEAHAGVGETAVRCIQRRRTRGFLGWGAWTQREVRVEQGLRIARRNALPPLSPGRVLVDSVVNKFTRQEVIEWHGLPAQDVLLDALAAHLAGAAAHTGQLPRALRIEAIFGEPPQRPASAPGQSSHPAAECEPSRRELEHRSATPQQEQKDTAIDTPDPSSARASPGVKLAALRRRVGKRDQVGSSVTDHQPSEPAERDRVENADPAAPKTPSEPAASVAAVSPAAKIAALKRASGNRRRRRVTQAPRGTDKSAATGSERDPKPDPPAQPARNVLDPGPPVDDAQARARRRRQEDHHRGDRRLSEPNAAGSAPRQEGQSLEALDDANAPARRQTEEPAADSLLDALRPASWEPPGPLKLDPPQRDRAQGPAAHWPDKWNVRVLGSAKEQRSDDGAAVSSPEFGMNLAVTDGATRATNSADWAQDVADLYVQLPPNEKQLASKGLLAWLTPAMDHWQRSLRPPADRKGELLRKRQLARGTHAALAGVSFEIDTKTQMDAEQIKFVANLVGDSVLIIKTANDVRVWPSSNADDFTNHPLLLSTVAEQNLAREDHLPVKLSRVEGVVDPGARIFLATDALGEWAVRGLAAGGDPLTRLWRLKDEAALERLVARAVSGEEMRIDDVKLVMAEVPSREILGLQPAADKARKSGQRRAPGPKSHRRGRRGAKESAADNSPKKNKRRKRKK